MEKENSFGAIKVPMMVIFTKTTFMETVSTSGQMAESTMVNGSTIKWKAKVPSHGVMDVDTLDNIKMIRNTVKEPLSGQMVESISENGTKESNTDKVHT